MKPPVRTRSAPSRYDVGPSAGLAPARVPWTAGEKRRLIRALKAQAPPGDLQAELLREHLPRRTAAEILAFVHQLKGRVAREAIRTEYRRCREEQRRKRAEILAPIEVWTDLAEKLTDKLEETMTAAFSQVMGISAQRMSQVPMGAKNSAGSETVLAPYSVFTWSHSHCDRFTGCECSLPTGQGGSADPLSVSDMFLSRGLLPRKGYVSAIARCRVGAGVRRTHCPALVKVPGSCRVGEDFQGPVPRKGPPRGGGDGISSVRFAFKVTRLPRSYGVT